MTLLEAIALAAGGLVAGIINTLAGGGSLLTVPMLVMLGLPGTVANGTNRIGVLVMTAVAAWSFRKEGVSGFRGAAPLLLPVALGAVVGAVAISQVADDAFEKLFGLVMLLLLIPTLRPPKAAKKDADAGAHASSLGTFLVFLAIGLYGGAFQAGVGIFLVLALSYAGFDLVHANSVKVVIVLCFTILAVPVFIAEGQIEWLPGIALGVGFAAGGAIGARVAVRGGERVIRPVLTLAIVALAGRMLGLY